MSKTNTNRPGNEAWDAEQDSAFANDGMNSSYDSAESPNILRDDEIDAMIQAQQASSPVPAAGKKSRRKKKANIASNPSVNPQTKKTVMVDGLRVAKSRIHPSVEEEVRQRGIKVNVPLAALEIPSYETIAMADHHPHEPLASVFPTQELLQIQEQEKAAKKKKQNEKRLNQQKQNQNQPKQDGKKQDARSGDAKANGARQNEKKPAEKKPNDKPAVKPANAPEAKAGRKQDGKSAKSAAAPAPVPTQETPALAGTTNAVLLEQQRVLQSMIAEMQRTLAAVQQSLAQTSAPAGERAGKPAKLQAEKPTAQTEKPAEAPAGKPARAASEKPTKPQADRPAKEQTNRPAKSQADRPVKSQDDRPTKAPVAKGNEKSEWTPEAAQGSEPVSKPARPQERPEKPGRPLPERAERAPEERPAKPQGEKPAFASETPTQKQDASERGKACVEKPAKGPKPATPASEAAGQTAARPAQEKKPKAEKPARADKPAGEKVLQRKSPMANSPFLKMGLSAGMLKALEDAMYFTPSPIQEKLIPLAMKGQDIIGQAQTGTGKTASFAIPILERIQFDEDCFDPQALILLPTRELAVQVKDEFEKLAKYTDFEIVALYGGKPLPPQVQQLRAGVDIVIGTPGRVKDHIARSSLKLDKIKILVLDEADRMLDIGFRPDIERILRLAPQSRQTLLLSATIPPPVESLARRYMYEPEMLDCSQKDISNDTIEQFYFTVEPLQKFEMLEKLLQRENPKQAIIFCRTKRGTDKVYTRLSKLMPGVQMIHGDLQQRRRDSVMKAFREGRIRYLVATDVVGRGIDVTGISHIINYDIPESCDDYVHRVGRTGRMGREGVAFTFVAPEEGNELTRIEMRINRLLTRDKIDDVPSMQPVVATDEAGTAPANEAEEAAAEKKRKNRRNETQ